MALEGYTTLHLEITDDGTIQKWENNMVSLQKQVRYLRQELSNTSYNEAQRQSVRLLLADAQIGLQATQTRSRELFGTLSLLPGPMGNLFGVVNMTLIAMRELSQLSFNDLKSQFQILKSTFTGESLSSGIPRTGVNTPTGTQQAIPVEPVIPTNVAQTAEGAALGNAAGTVGVKAATDAIKEQTNALKDNSKEYIFSSATKSAFFNDNGLLINQLEELEKSNKNLNFEVRNGAVLMSQVPYATRQVTDAELELLTTNKAVIVTENGMIKALADVTLWQRMQITWWNLTGAAMKAYDAVVIFTTGYLEGLGFSFVVADTAAKVFTFTLATLSTAGIALLAAGLGFLIAKLYELATGTKAADAEMKQLGVDVQENTEFLKDQLGINQRFQQENIARMKAGNAAESDLRKQNLKDAKDNLNQINDAYDQAVRNRDAIERRVFEGKGGEKGGEIMKKANEEVLKLQTERNNQIAKINEIGYNDQEIKLKLAIDKSLKEIEAAIQLEINKENTKNDTLLKLQKERDAIIDAQNAKKGVTLGPNEIAEREKKNADVRRNAVLDDEIRRAQDQIDIHTREKEAAAKDSEEYFKSLEDIAKSERDKQKLEAEKSEHDKANIIKNAESKLTKELDDIYIARLKSQLKISTETKEGLTEYTQEYYQKELDIINKNEAIELADYEGNEKMKLVITEKYNKQRLDLESKQLMDNANLLKRLGESETEGNLGTPKNVNKSIDAKFKLLQQSLDSEYQAEIRNKKKTSTELAAIDAEYNKKTKLLNQQKLAEKQVYEQKYVDLAKYTGDFIMALGEAEMAASQGKDKSKFDSAKKYAVAGIWLEKAAALGSIYMNTQKAMSQDMGKFGVFGIPLTAIDLAIGVAQAAGVIVAGATAASSINGTDFSPAASSNMGKNYASGGMINGADHSQGGVNINAQGGEAVMTRGAVTMFQPLLSMMNQMGGGTAFSGAVAGQAKWDNPKSPGSPTEPQIIKTYVVQSDLTSAQQRQARLKSLSTL